MILIMVPLAVVVICVILYNKLSDDDALECIGCVLAISLVSLIILCIAAFLMRACDSDQFQVEMDRANIERYIELYGDDADTNEDVYNTIYDKVYSFNYTVYKRQKTRSSLLTSWFRAGWWLDIEPINWTP